MKTKEELKLYFEKGDKPTQEQFWQWMDSYWHKEEKVSLDSIDSIEKVVPFFDGEDLKGSGVVLTIPSNTKKILSGSYIFSGMSYQIIKVIFNEGLDEIESSAFNSQNIKSIQLPSSLRIIRNSAFANQGNLNNGTDSLEEIILNEGVSIIENYAFSCGRATVQDLYIPSSLQSVGQGAFAIPSLQTVSAPSGLDLSNAGIPSTAIITYR